MHRHFAIGWHSSPAFQRMRNRPSITAYGAEAATRQTACLLSVCDIAKR